MLTQRAMNITEQSMKVERATVYNHGIELGRVDLGMPALRDQQNLVSQLLWSANESIAKLNLLEILSRNVKKNDFCTRVIPTGKSPCPAKWV